MSTTHHDLEGDAPGVVPVPNPGGQRPVETHLILRSVPRFWPFVGRDQDAAMESRALRPIPRALLCELTYFLYVIAGNHCRVVVHCTHEKANRL